MRKRHPLSPIWVNSRAPWELNNQLFSKGPASFKGFVITVCIVLSSNLGSQLSNFLIYLKVIVVLCNSTNFEDSFNFNPCESREVYMDEIRGNRGTEETTLEFRGSEERIFHAREEIFKMQKTSKECGNNR